MFGRIVGLGVLLLIVWAVLALFVGAVKILLTVSIVLIVAGLLLELLATLGLFDTFRRPRN